MGRNAPKGGAPVTPAVTTAGTPGTSAQVWTFTRGSVRPCFVGNTSSTTVLFLKVNSADAVTATDWVISIPSLGWYDVSQEGLINVDSIKAWMAVGGSFASIVINGFPF